MPGRGKKAREPAGQHTNTQAEIDRALSIARSHLRWRRGLRLLAATISVPVLLSALWVVVYRVTLADFPAWPVLAFPLSLPAIIYLLAKRARITRTKGALYLDRALGLEQRLTTLIELEGRVAASGETPGQSFFRRRLEEEAAELLATRLPLLSGKYRSKFVRWQAALASLSVACLLLAVVMPTTLEAARTELHVVRGTVDEQAKQIADLRAELVSRPGIPDRLKEDLAAELERLEEQLRSVNSDRAEALATLAEVEERVRELLPNVSSAEFEPLVQAARMIQLIAASESDWDPSLTKESTDLGKAAEATQHLKDYVNQFTNPQARAVANTLDRASAVAATNNPELGRQLGEASGGLRRSEGEKAQAALEDVSRLFREAEREEQAARAVENALAKLEDSRQSIAKAGATASDRKQVGFRRSAGKSDAGGGDAATGAEDQPGEQGTAEAGGGSGNLANGGPNTSANVPAFGPLSGSGGSSGSTQPGNQAGSGNGGNSGSDSQGGQPTGQNASGQPGGGGGGAGTGAKGPVQGPISGPIKGGAGTTNGAGGAQGTGIGTASAQQGGGQSAERVYVPGRQESQGGVIGQASPEFPTGDGVTGRVGEGASGAEQPGGPGVGTLSTIHTPYRDVLGQYTQQATEALERAYVPPDAKEYVRDYFTALGK